MTHSVGAGVGKVSCAGGRTDGQGFVPGSWGCLGRSRLILHVISDPAHPFLEYFFLLEPHMGK